MTASAGPVLKRLHEEFADVVDFVTLYVREAHPGDRYPQPETLEEKLVHARDYQERDRIRWDVLVDTPDGGLHRRLDGKPNASYLIGPDGRLLFRSLWSHNERSLRQVLSEVRRGRVHVLGESQPLAVPMLAGMGSMYGILREAGPTAQRDVLLKAPPMYLMARLAAMLPFSPLHRGLAAAATTAVTAGVIGRAVRRRRGTS